MVDIDKIKVNDSWQNIFKIWIDSPNYKNIKSFLLKEEELGNVVYPIEENIFSAFNLTDRDNVNVVILWQDPYHWEWEANWLCFSVGKSIKHPPSLRNIFKELKNDLDIDNWINWDLSNRAKQWILLINSTLTVKKDSPNSHKDIWWLEFTDFVIKSLSDKKDGLIFVLWWAYAQTKESIIDKDRHYIIKSPHPSPFSAYKWFFGSKPFSKINELLSKQNKNIIDRKL